MGKRRIGARQAVLVLTQTSGVEFINTESDKLYAASHNTREAWALDPNQQAKHEKTGEYLQVVSEISYKPLQIFQNRSIIDSGEINSVASVKQDEVLTSIESKAQKNSLVLWVGIVAAVLAITAALLVLLKLKTSDIALAAIPLIGSISNLVNKSNTKKVSTDDDLKKLLEKETGQVFAIIFVEKTHTYGMRQIDMNLIPEDCHERQWKGNAIYVLALDTDGKLSEIGPPEKVNPEEAPSRAYMALDWPEIEEVLSMPLPPMEKVKIGILVLLCVCLMILIFLLVPMLAGG